MPLASPMTCQYTNIYPLLNIHIYIFTYTHVQAQNIVTEVDFHFHDADAHWWTDMNHYEGTFGIEDRTSDFLHTAQFCDSPNPIFIGHSNFFRNFCASHLSEALKINRPVLAENMLKFRLSNATMLAVTVLFEPDADDTGTFMSKSKSQV